MIAMLLAVPLLGVRREDVELLMDGFHLSRLYSQPPLGYGDIPRGGPAGGRLGRPLVLAAT